MKLHNHVQVCMMNSNCDCFTTHCLHMNAKGKDWLVNTWASIIKSLRSTSLSTTAIPLPDQSTNRNIGNDSINDSDYTDRTVLQVISVSIYLTFHRSL